MNEIAAFVHRAKEHKRGTEIYWDALRSNIDGFEPAFAATLLKDAYWFFAYADDAFLAKAFTADNLCIWRTKEDEGWLSGVTRIISRLRDAGLEPHAQELACVLLRRASFNDFPAQIPGGRAEGFNNAAWLLLNVRGADSEVLRRFLESLFQTRWLNAQYGKGDLLSLASGFRLLALNPDWREVRQRAKSPVLDDRLKAELSKNLSRDPEHYSAVIQSVGTIFMLKMQIDPRLLRHLAPADVAGLPMEVLPHRPDVPYVEDFQLQLWWGIRAYQCLNPQRKRLALDRPLLDDTRARWVVRAEHSKSDTETRAHELDLVMLRWLDAQLNLVGKRA